MLEFTFADHAFSMTVGRVEFLHRRPIAFSEFLAAAGRFEDIPDTAHACLFERLRVFLFFGGVPETVCDFLV